MDFHPLGDHFQLPSCGSQPCAADPAPSWTPGSGTPPSCSSPPPAGLTAPNLECWKEGSQPATRSASSHVGPVGPYNSSVPHGSFSCHPTANPPGGPAGSSFRSHPRTPALSPPGHHPPALSADWLHCPPPHSPPDRLIFTVPPHSGRWDALTKRSTPTAAPNFPCCFHFTWRRAHVLTPAHLPPHDPGPQTLPRLLRPTSRSPPATWAVATLSSHLHL